MTEKSGVQSSRIAFLSQIQRFVDGDDPYPDPATCAEAIPLIDFLFQNMSFRTWSGIYANNWIPAFTGMTRMR